MYQRSVCGDIYGRRYLRDLSMGCLQGLSTGVSVVCPQMGSTGVLEGASYGGYLRIFDGLILS